MKLSTSPLFTDERCRIVKAASQSEFDFKPGCEGTRLRNRNQMPHIIAVATHNNTTGLTLHKAVQQSAAFRKNYRQELS